jgi:hypothetical protein
LLRFCWQYYAEKAVKWTFNVINDEKSVEMEENLWKLWKTSFFFSTLKLFLTTFFCLLFQSQNFSPFISFHNRWTSKCFRLLNYVTSQCYRCCLIKRKKGDGRRGWKQLKTWCPFKWTLQLWREKITNRTW